MITSGTYKKEKFFNADEKLLLLHDVMHEILAKYHFQILSWVLLSNHYHLLLMSEKGSYLPEAIRMVHGKSATLLNKIDKIPGRRVWYNYWDTMIKDEEDIENKIAYIFMNPVKHGIVKDPIDYPFSSIQEYLRTNGLEKVKRALEKYNERCGVYDVE
jgi:putative transposase